MKMNKILLSAALITSLGTSFSVTKANDKTKETSFVMGTMKDMGMRIEAQARMVRDMVILASSSPALVKQQFNEMENTIKDIGNALRVGGPESQEQLLMLLKRMNEQITAMGKTGGVFVAMITKKIATEFPIDQITEYLLSQEERLRTGVTDIAVEMKRGAGMTLGELTEKLAELARLLQG